jgi:hypothetical protein
MLPSVNAEDSGAPVQPPHSCFVETAHEVSRLVFAAKAPCGAFTLAKQPPNPVGLIVSPQASHSVCPTVGACAANAAVDVRRLSGTQKKYTWYFVIYASEPHGSGNCASLGATSLYLPPERRSFTDDLGKQDTDFRRTEREQALSSISRGEGLEGWLRIVAVALLPARRGARMYQGALEI